MPYISQLDTQNTFRPLLSPPQNHGGQSIRSIVIDPGHGGPQPGYIVGGQAEKKYTLLLAQELQEQLKRAGFKVSLTRTGDREVSSPDVQTSPSAAGLTCLSAFILMLRLHRPQRCAELKCMRLHRPGLPLPTRAAKVRTRVVRGQSV